MHCLYFGDPGALNKRPASPRPLCTWQPTSPAGIDNYSFFCVNTLPLPELLYIVSEEFSLNVTLLEPASLSSYFVNN